MQNDQPMLRQIRLGQRINDRVANGRIEVLAGLSDGDVIALDPVAAGRVAQQ